MTKKTDVIDDAYLRKKFAQLDSDQDGKLSLTDLKKGFIGSSHVGTDANIFLQKFDINQDGYISYEEFIVYVVNQQKQLKAVFDELDADKNGTLDSHEVEEGLRKLGLSISHAKSLLHRADRDKNDLVDFVEWQDMLMFAPAGSARDIFTYWAKSAAIDIGESLAIPDDTKGGIAAWKYLVAGGVAGAVSRTATAPLDRLKVLLQVGAGNHGVLSGLKRIYEEGGTRGFFRGNGTNVIKIAPETAIKFMAYERIKKLVSSDHQITGSERFFAGALAGVISQSTIFPMECVKTRLAVASAGTYKGIVDCLGKTVSQEGFFALYKGLGPALCGVVPYAGTDLAVYEYLKTALINHSKKNGTEPGMLPLFFCGVASSTCGQLVSYPLALVRTRLQAQGMAGHPKIYNGSFDAFRKILKNDGFLGLYRGIVPNFLKVAPAVSISYAVYETVKKMIE